MGKSRLDLMEAYKANKRNNALTDAKIAAGVALTEQTTPASEEMPAEESKVSAKRSQTATARKGSKKGAARKTQSKADTDPLISEKPATKKVGRPNLDKEGDEPSSVRSFKLPDRQISAIDYYCMKNRGVVKTEVVREALDEFFESNGVYDDMRKMGLLQ